MDFQLSLHSELVSAAHPTQPLAIEPTTSLREVLLLMRAQSSGSVLVCEDGKLTGIFTERDAMKAMSQGTDLSKPIASVMSKNVESLKEDSTVGEAIRKMAAGSYRRLPIVDGNNLPVGVTGTRGILHYLVEHFPDAIYTLPPNPSAGPTDREGA